LHNWYETKDVKNWLNQYQIAEMDIPAIDAIYALHNNWCLSNEFSFTPCIFINDYQYPDSYERESLEFFINDLIEDEF
jgi:hypothetical protein